METRDLSAHEPYRAGRGIDEVARRTGRDADSFVALASNENTLGPSPRAVVAIQDAAEGAHTYPKAAHVSLRERLASHWSVGPDQVWVANGGDGAIDYLSRAMLEPGDSVLVPRPGFAYYGMSARFHHGSVRSYPLEREADFAVSATSVLESYDGERIIYLTSPHNPTGTTVGPGTVREIAQKTADHTLIVVDEAYGEFATTDSAISIIRDGARDDVAVLRTFSKAYGLAGVRLGYALVPEEWAGAYDRVNTPFAASEIACRAGLAAIEDEAHVDRSVETARSSRETMMDRIEATVWPSEGNFVLVDVGDATAVSAALEERGVLVRDCSSFGLEACIRITTGTESETQRAVEAVNRVFAEGEDR